MGFKEVKLITEAGEGEVRGESIRVLDLTNKFWHKLEDGFPAVARAMSELKRDEHPLSMFLPSLTYDEVVALQNIAAEEQFLPVVNGTFGVNHLEIGSHVWRRLLFYTFEGRRLWKEIISPYFDHELFGSIINSRVHAGIILHDVEAGGGFHFGADTPLTRRARWISSLMHRAGFESRSPLYELHCIVSEHVRKELRIQRIDEAPQAWSELCQKYWELNEHQLFTEEMELFMQGRTLVAVEIDFE